MLPWLRNIILIFLVLSLIYAVLRFTSRYTRRQKLISEYEAGPKEASQKDTSQEVYVAAGLKKYDKSLRPKLFVFVFLIPIMIMGVLIYLAQYS